MATPSTTTAPNAPLFDLHSKVHLVTGAAQGLGLVLAAALLAQGSTVYALDMQPPPDAATNPALSDLQARYPGRLHYRRIDVRAAVALRALVADIAAAHAGRIDGLIAAAGIQQESPALEYVAADANRLLEVNVTGVLLTAQAVAAEMIKGGRGGSIVLIGSMSGTVANRGLLCSVYNASKAAVLQLARNLAAEWGVHGIRVNTISPGYIVTPMVESLFEQYPERRDEWPNQNMLGRLSVPEDYSGAAVFLLSDASSFMTAADLKIDGGHSAW